jgi:CheY-like chemotaxis protein
MDYRVYRRKEPVLQTVTPGVSDMPWVEPRKRLRVLIWGKDGVYHQFHTILATNIRNWGYEAMLLPPSALYNSRTWQKMEGDVLLYDMDVSLPKAERGYERGRAPLFSADAVLPEPLWPRVRLLVALSSYSVSRHSLEQLGAVTLLHKPFDMSHLERYLRVFQQLFYTAEASVNVSPGPVWCRHLETADQESAQPAFLPQKPLVRILVADDCREVTQTIHQYLGEGSQLYEYEVREAHDGLELLEQCLDWWPQCVVTDLLMPWLNGYQVMQCLAAGQFQSIPAFVVISALLHHENLVTRSYLQDKVVLYVDKPFDVGNLLASIEQALAQ